jgi:hypothetical protein
MKFRRWALALISTALLISAANAAPASPAEVEISYLLQHIETSGCEFYRNGSWYNGMRAQAHLRSKYEYLVARNPIGSAEDFIDKVATKSSVTNQPYRIRCAGFAAVTSSNWLRDALAAYRAAKPDPVPH